MLCAERVSRILDGEGRIERIVNNYAKISFNFGPTLLAWIEGKAPDVYLAILEATARVGTLLGAWLGDGASLQPHDYAAGQHAGQSTQVVWGIADFEYRFGRKPEGMWLPETAVDLETLDVLAEQGIRFTILAPYQAESGPPDRRQQVE